jgi:hypothetical protein
MRWWQSCGCDLVEEGAVLSMRNGGEARGNGSGLVVRFGGGPEGDREKRGGGGWRGHDFPLYELARA